MSTVQQLTEYKTATHPCPDCEKPAVFVPVTMQPSDFFEGVTVQPLGYFQCECGTCFTVSENGTWRGTEDCQDALIAAERSRRKQAARPRIWNRDLRVAMSELAQMFPTLQGVPGTNPWEVETFLRWMNGPAPTSGSFAAGMFLLGVWNPKTDWNEEGLQKRFNRILGGKRKLIPGKFDMFRAVGCWDEEHFKAFMTWIQNPFWP